MNSNVRISDTRNVWQGQRMGEGSGTGGGKGPDSTLTLLTRFCTRCDLSLLRMKSGFEEDIWEVNCEALWATPSIVYHLHGSHGIHLVESILTAASIWMKSAMTKSRENSFHSSALKSPWTI